MSEPEISALRLSRLVAAFAEREETRFSVGEMVDAFGSRALAALILVFALICILPLPPGATTVFGLPLLLLAPQLAIGAHSPWAPQWLRRRQMSARPVRPAFRRMASWLRRMEAFSHPRLTVLVSAPSARLIGVICTLFAVVLILPIPLGNMLPAATVSAFSFALLQRDGLVAAVGYLLAVASVSVLALAAHLILGVLRHVASAISAFDGLPIS